MTVQLSSLRVAVEGDTSTYVTAMGNLAAANDSATASTQKLADTQAKASVAQAGMTTVTTSNITGYSNQTLSLQRLQGQLDPAYAAQNRFAMVQTTLQRALDQSAITLDRYNALMGIATKNFEDAGRKASPVASQVELLRGQIVALSAGLGPAGVLLAGFGPWGLAAAGGIGLVTSAIGYLTEQSNKLGEMSSKLNDFSQTAGITATQIQVLEKAGAGVGLTTDQVAQSFERFSVNLAESRKGAGQFFDEIQKVSPALAMQLATTRDSATAWNLLAQAYSQADSQQQALIAHAAFGRGGAGSGRLLTTTAEAGGISGLQRQAGQSGIISDDDVQRIGALKVRIDEVNASAAIIRQSIFTEDVLQRELQFAENMKKAAEAAKDLAQAGSGLSWVDRMANAAAAWMEDGVGPGSVRVGLTEEQAARSRMSRGLTSNAATGGGTDWASKVWQPNLQPGAPAPNQLDPELIANRMKTQVAALGSAATAYEQQAVKVAELDVALKNNTITQDTYNRSLAGLKLDTVLQLEGQRLSLLGQLAPVSETVTQKENQITAARIKGVTITSQEADAITRLTQSQGEGARLQEQVTIGVANETAIRAQLARELQTYIDRKLLDPTSTQQMADAQVVLAKRLEATAKQAEVARAPLEQLKALEIDSRDPRTQIDQFSVTSLNNFTTNMADFTTGTKSATDAFKNLGAQVLRSLEEMLIKMAIVAPIAKALQQSLGGFLPSFGGVNPSVEGSVGVVGLNGPIPTPTFMAGGGEMSAGGWGVVGERGPEIIQTLPSGGVRVHSNDSSRRMLSAGLPGFAAGGYLPAPAANGNQQQVIINNYSGAETKTTKRSQNGVDIMEVVIGKVKSEYGNGGFDGLNRARYGNQVRAKPR